MARAKTTATSPPAAPGARATGTRADGSGEVGPPLLILGLGYLSVLVSVPLIGADGIAAHVVGYLAGGLLPIVVVGLVRRVDLDRRRSPSYRARSFVRPALLVLAVVAFAAAGLHIWPIATELAS